MHSLVVGVPFGGSFLVSTERVETLDLSTSRHLFRLFWFVFHTDTIGCCALASVTQEVDSFISIGHLTSELYDAMASGHHPRFSPVVPCEFCTHVSDFIQRSVGAQAEVSAGHVVADGGRDDCHRDAELRVLVSVLTQDQCAVERLQGKAALKVSHNQLFE